MSYVSGFMMGAAIGKGIRQFLGGSNGTRLYGAQPQRLASGAALAASGQVQPFALVASTPGRRRYRAHRIRPELALLLEERLSRLPYLSSVQVSAASGSILVTFDEKDAAKVTALMADLGTRLFACTHVHHRRGIVDESHAGFLTRSVRSTGRAASHWLKKNTGGALDVNMLVAILFAVRGLQKIMTSPAPTGAQLLWWALSLVRGWRTV